MQEILRWMGGYELQVLGVLGQFVRLPGWDCTENLQKIPENQCTSCFELESNNAETTETNGVAEGFLCQMKAFELYP